MKGTIRVLQVIGKMDRGGAETMIMNLYRNIDRNKIQFDFIVHTNDKGNFDDEITSLGGRIYRVPRFKGYNLLSYIKSWRELLRNFNSKYRIIHGHIGSTAYIYLSIANKLGMITIAHSHSAGYSQNIRGLIYKILSFPTRYVADYLISCSKKASISRYGKKVINNGKHFILNNAIDTEKYIYNPSVRKKIRKNLNIDKEFVIGHVGRFTEEKNHKFIIEIFKKVHDVNTNAVLLLIGEGKLRKHIENKVYELELKNSVIFLGVRSDVPDLMQAMDVFLFPSLYEGLGIVSVEAQASGLHTIVSEAVPEEAYLTDLIEKEYLSSSPSKWANRILNYANGYERKNTYKEIYDAGYDVEQNTQWLEEFYLAK